MSQIFMKQGCVITNQLLFIQLIIFVSDALIQQFNSVADNLKVK